MGSSLDRKIPPSNIHPISYLKENYPDSVFLNPTDEEISKIIEKQYARAIQILKEHKDKLIELAEILTEKEVIFEGDLHKIFGERPFAKEIEESKEVDPPKVKVEDAPKVEPEASETDTPKEEITEENSK